MKMFSTGIDVKKTGDHIIDDIPYSWNAENTVDAKATIDQPTLLSTTKHVKSCTEANIPWNN